jgi:hypothetical protein
MVKMLLLNFFLIEHLENNPVDDYRFEDFGHVQGQGIPALSWRM